MPPPYRSSLEGVIDAIVDNGGGGGAQGPGTAATAQRVTYASDGSTVPVTSPTPGNVSLSIGSGTSLSAGVAVNGKIVGLVLPAAWTAASLTFQGSYDGGTTYVDLWDIVSGTATERNLTNTQVQALLGRYLALSLNDWLGLTHVRIRSGTAAAAVNQAAARNLIFALAG